MANEVDGGDHGELQQSIGSVGAFSKDEAAVAFTAAYWSWLRCQRDYAPYAEEHGLTYAQGAAILRQIKLTDEYRKLRHEYAMSNPFSKWTEADVAAFNARTNTLRRPSAQADDVGGCRKSVTGSTVRAHRIPAKETSSSSESDLHDAIFAECRRRGWIAFHGSMAHATKRVAGEPDYQIYADRGRVFLIEVKSAKGKLSPDQLAIKCWAAKLGHTVHVVRSMAEFLEITK